MAPIQYPYFLIFYVSAGRSVVLQIRDTKLLSTYYFGKALSRIKCCTNFAFLDLYASF